MSFHFKRLRLKDWLVYGGVTEIDLPDFQEGRNLVVFNGSNGYGKTSLLRALAFVFHGRSSKNELRDELWNQRARNLGDGSLEVGIEFTHADKVCRLLRGADFRPWGNTTAVTPWVKLYIDGEEHDTQVDDKIEQLLPRDCLEFLFFDGAEISRYAQKQHEIGVREAIEKVLGIPAVRNLRSDLDALTDELEREQERLLGQSSQADQLLTEVNAMKDEEQNYLTRRQDLAERRQSLETTRDELLKEAEGIEAIDRERRELHDKQHRRADMEERRADLNAQIQQIITRIPLLLLEEPLKQITEELRAKREPSPRREDKMAHLQVLKQLIDAEECICERNITPEIRDRLKTEVDRLEKIMKRRQPSLPDLGDLLELSTLVKTIDSIPRNPDELIDKRSAVNTQLEELETDIYRLRQQLEGHDNVSVNELFQQIRQLDVKIEESRHQIETIDNNLERLRGALQQKQRQLAEIGAGNEQARGVTRVLDESRRLQSAISELVEELVGRKREGIESIATDIFRHITNKPEEYDRIAVRVDYTLEVVRKDGTVVENHRLSAGEKEVLAYSFITALNLSSIDPAPFVMDTPFGHLDSAHRSGLLRSLPRLQVQAILLATDRDLPPAERDSIERSIIKEYCLKRDQRRAITTIEEN